MERSDSGEGTMARIQDGNLLNLDEISVLIDAFVQVGAIGKFTGAHGACFLVDDIYDVTANPPRVEYPPDLGQISLPLDGLSFEDNHRSTPTPTFVLPDGSILARTGSHRRQGRQPLREVGALLRQLLREAGKTPALSNEYVPTTSSDVATPIELPDGWMLETTNAQMRAVCEDFATRTQTLVTASAYDFANTAYYMGTKRTLTPLIAQACTMWLPRDTYVLDLMCGSGAVSGALSRIWPVAASDAMRFCQNLALVQSSGFSESEAQATIDEVTIGAELNLRRLTDQLGESLTREDNIFHSSESGDDFRQAYWRFAAEFPTFPRGGKSPDGWDPLEEVSIRQLGTSSPEAPACLFTCYYSNVYFGLRQAAEIDSLRYGISRIRHSRRRNWALGALITAVSRIGTAYGGHFAQPFFPASALLDAASESKKERLLIALKQRTLSVWREFQARLLALGQASETHSHEVQALKGPWRAALRSFNEIPHAGSKLVYLDAPYRRDEYSRYYHVLETLVGYDYPSAETPAKMPSKTSGDRFASEFATRTRATVTESLADIIATVLEAGHVCAWSYSDKASSSVPEVLSALRCKPAEIRSVAAQHKHKPQGGHSSRLTVHEYVVVLWP
jgi:hypothetical protein